MLVTKGRERTFFGRNIMILKGAMVHIQSQHPSNLPRSPRRMITDGLVHIIDCQLPSFASTIMAIPLGGTLGAVYVGNIAASA